MSQRAVWLFEKANQLELIKVSLIQMKQHEVARSLEQPVEILRKEAELELMEYERRYLR